jgi:pimeloyl-ACP methyl ester carboxylesterase
MHTFFATSPDGTQIAYDITGTGPALLLLHGGGHTRGHWHAAGYVERLQSAFTVIAIDIRGNGASDKPTDPAAYTTDKHCQDVLAVADACGVARFTLWGFSYGGNIGRYLAARSERIAKLIVIGIPFGLGAAGAFRQSISDFRDHWEPIVQAQRDGTLDLAALSSQDHDRWHATDVPLTLAWLSAMLDWEAIEPADLHCPTLWLAGSENADALASMRAYTAALNASLVHVQIVAGLNHAQEFTDIDTMVPAILAFATD